MTTARSVRTGPLRDLLPPDVEVVQSTGAPTLPLRVHPVDAAAVAGASALRRTEFLDGRRCALEALVRLGTPVEVLPLGPDRAPVWPAGVVGSITHCQGLRAAAVGRAVDIAGIGIDAEPHRPTGATVLSRIADADEREHLSRLPPGVHWCRMLFSAKESVYKVWYPATGRWLGFEDARVRFAPDTDPGSGTFTVAVSPPAGSADRPMPFTRLAGRFRTDGRLLVTSVVRRLGLDQPDW